MRYFKALSLGLICLIFISGTVFGRTSRHSHRNSVTTPTPTNTPMIPSPTIQINPGDNLINGNWKYMPGVIKQSGGLLVQPLGFALVEQDGTFAQFNPPVNLAGTYLNNLTGDFQIGAKMDLQDSKTATLQFYGRAPIIADEFRMEKESVKASIQNGLLTVSIWNGRRQTASSTKVFPFAPSSGVSLAMGKAGNLLQFSVNGQVLGSMTDPGVFNTKQLWFGMDSSGGTWLLKELTAAKLASGNFDIADSSAATATFNDPGGLQYLASIKRPGFIVGEVRAIGPAFTDPDYQKIALDKNMFGGMTMENELKMINTQPQPGIYSFEKADAMVQLAKQNGITVHGHTLVFGEANPVWFSELPTTTAQDKQKIETIMIDRVDKLVRHFGGDIKSWDVVNEPMADYDDTADGEGAVLRNNKWYQAMGEAYITKALVTAHTANPDAILFINEYGLEADGDRWDAFVALMQRVKSKLVADNVPVNKIGVGFQAHVYEAGDMISSAVLSRHIRQLGSMGFVTQISEMDVYGDDGLTRQASQYADVLRTCVNEPSCIAWRGWIITDKYDYFRDDDGQIYTGMDGLFDTTLKPRPAIASMQLVLQ